MNATVLRPLRIGEILDAAIKVYLRNARVLMGAAATAVIPLQAVVAAILLSIYSSGADVAGFGFAAAQASPEEARARLGGSAVQVVVSLIAVSFTSAACVKAVSDSYVDQPTGIGISLRFALRRLLPLLGLQILYIFGLAFAFLLLIVPGIWLYVCWSVAIPVMLVEGHGPLRTLRRSVRLVRGRWWPTAGALAVALLMVSLLSSVLTGLLTFLALRGHPSVLFAVLMVVLAQTISAVVLQPFSATVATVLFYDMRVRRDGYDVELLAEQLGLPQSALPSGGESNGFLGRPGPESVGRPGGPPYWPPPPGWDPEGSGSDLS